MKAVDETDRLILYNEWQRVEVVRAGRVSKASKRTHKVSRKVPAQEKVAILKKKLIKELLVLKDHLIRVHSQFKTFKAAREEAEQHENIVTVQRDWSENRKLIKSEEEKGGYHYENHVSLHPMYVWSLQGNYSKVAMGVSTNHTAPALMASLLPLLKELRDSGIRHLNVITDSPTSQYRNKGMFWLVKVFCEEFGIPLKWVYLESGHGKAIPDGIGATVAIENLMLMKPSVPMYSVSDLLENGLEEAVPFISIHTY